MFIDTLVSDEIQVKDEKFTGLVVEGDAVVFRGLLRRAESDQRSGERDSGLELRNEVVETVEI